MKPQGRARGASLDATVTVHELMKQQVRLVEGGIMRGHEVEVAPRGTVLATM